MKVEGTGALLVVDDEDEEVDEDDDELEEVVLLIDDEELVADTRLEDEIVLEVADDDVDAKEVDDVD